MTNIDSKKAEIPASAKEVFDFLSDMNNIEKLLPEGRYANFKSDGQSCSFKVGSYTIGLKFVSSEPYTKVSYESAQGTPFPFTLVVHLEEKEKITVAQLKSEAKINPFMEIMVKGPLNALFEHMSDKLITQFSKKTS